MTNTCPICGDLRCDCVEHYDPNNSQGMRRAYGLCLSCTADLQRLIGEQVSAKEEGVSRLTKKGHRGAGLRIEATLQEWTAQS